MKKHGKNILDGLVQKQERKRAAKLLVKTKQADLHTDFLKLMNFMKSLTLNPKPLS